MSLIRRRSSSSTENALNFRARTSITVSIPESPNCVDHTPKSMITFVQIVLILILSICPWLPSVMLKQKLGDLRQQVELSQAKSENFIQDVSQALDSRRQLSTQVKALEEDNNALLTSLKLHGNSVDPNNNLYQQAEDLEETYLGRIQDLERSIQRLSLLRLRTKSADDSVLRFRFNMVNGANIASKSFLVETVGLEESPHATAVFHETVQRDFLVDATAVAESGSPCFLLQPTESAAASMRSQSIRFHEKLLSSSAADKFNVMIGRRGLNFVVSFCFGTPSRHLNEGDLESVFATVASGDAFLQTLVRGANPMDWRVESVELI